MKDILKITVFSIIGGIITLSGYLFYIEKTESNFTALQKQKSFTIPVNNDIRTVNFDNIESISLTEAAEKTVNSVVHITNTATYIQPTNRFDLNNRKGIKRQVGSTGSGVIISEDGYIVTNNHVINEADELIVTLNNQKKYKARLIGFDRKNDIAVIKIDADEKLAYIPFGNSDNAKIGEWVLAVGNPYNLTSTVTAGIISAKSRDLDGDKNIQSFIQTDAAVNPGNSGGALVNTNGELIGINTAISSKTGSYVGYAFAVPSNTAKKIVEDLLEFGDVQEGVLGINGLGLNNSVANHFDIKDTEGYYIAGIEANSGAEEGGLQIGDVIKKLDDIRIKKSSDLSGYLSTKGPNSIIKVTILRNGETKTLAVKLSDNSILTQEAFGLSLQNLDKEEKENLELRNGVKVTKSNNLFLSEKLGITKSCVIITINEKPIESIADLNSFSSLSITQLYNLEVVYPDGKSKNWWLK